MPSPGRGGPGQRKAEPTWTSAQLELMVLLQLGRCCSIIAAVRRLRSESEVHGRAAARLLVHATVHDRFNERLHDRDGDTY